MSYMAANNFQIMQHNINTDTVVQEKLKCSTPATQITVQAMNDDSILNP